MCSWEGDTLSCGPAECFALVVGYPQFARLRAGVRAFLQDASPDRMADAVQVVDELASNAAQHGRPPIQLQLTRRDDGGTLWVAVYDGSPQPPQLVPAGVSVALPWHLGMRITNALSTAWGVVREAEGKTVWAKLPLAEQAP